MPDVGTPVPHSTYATSHTSSEQWQSFEIRMRHRRAERCLLRAEIALEAGLEADARIALDEARALNPAAPDFETLRTRIAERARIEAPNHLTPRQIECLKWVAEGKTDEEIGAILSLSDRTVHNHIEAAKRGLGVTKRSQAALLAYRRGWIT